MVGRKTRTALSVVAPILITASYLNAERISVSQSLDNSNIAYEDSAVFEITLQWDGPQSAYLFDKPLNPHIDRLKVRGFTSSISSSGSSGKEITTKGFRYTLVPTSAGVGRIDPITISYLSWPDSLPGELVTEAMTISIAEPVKNETVESRNVVLWVVIAASTALATAVAVFVRAKYRRTRDEPAKAPKETLLEGLAALKDDAGSDLKRFQVGLYKILVEFFKTKYDIDAVDLGKEDLKRELGATDLTGDQIERMAGWLIQAQKDKYSPVVATPGAVIRLESEIREFFEKMQS